MPTRTVTIYEVPVDYVAGTDSTIIGVSTMIITDDDSLLEQQTSADSGTDQTFNVDGVLATDYYFFYDDSVDINGGAETVKTFGVTIGGVDRYFIMSDNDDELLAQA